MRNDQVFMCVLHYSGSLYNMFRADPEDAGVFAQALADGATFLIELDDSQSVLVLPAHNIDKIWFGWKPKSTHEIYPKAALTFIRKDK
jgi:hypothetical protein